MAAVPITPTRPLRVARDGTAHRGQDHLDDRNRRVALPRVAQAGRGRRVARDHQCLDAAVGQVVTDRQGVGPDLRNRQRPVRPVAGITDVDDFLIGQLVDHRPGHGESTDTGIEDADR